MWSVQVLVVAVVVSVCTAHLCMLSPPQRGSLVGFNKKGADDCFLIKGPCGKRPISSNPILLRGNQNFTVVFQKNLDHWAQATPGMFTISFGPVDQTNVIATIPDMGEPSLTLYAINITIPTLTTGSYVIQTQYVTKNPQAPPTFYQCGDVTLV
ncbi:hypothetical protein LOTGIDRAFT_203715 [Lottia gigantea]|uniref:Reelin domain-containing protein n=1 Tax=Lottia gigantea TaxID=225164 RepID=V4ATM9_LOTGI|nr:hypothetical protein LOTGIDRAFT_203715 [Lottia gigantea]ESO98270.1 hypothetical protein LOTGIDRAFT_203715 [Lottia gigantea]